MPIDGVKGKPSSTTTPTPQATTPRPNEATSQPAAPTPTSPSVVMRRTALDDQFQAAPTGSRAQAAIEQFDRRMTEILLSSRVATGEPQPSPEHVRELQRAAGDLLQNLPIGSFAPGVVARIESALASRGVAPGDLTGKSLKDLGRLGGDIAQELAMELRDERPAVFYGLAAVAAGAIGYTAYAEGSRGIERLGVRPEIKTRLFNDNVTVGVRARWEARFRNPSADLSVSTALGPVAGRASLLANVDREGVQRLEGRYQLQQNDLSVSASLRHDLARDVTSAAVEVRYEPRRNVALSVEGEVDADGNKKAEVKVSIKF